MQIALAPYLLALPILGGCATLRGRPVAVRHSSGETVTGVRWTDTLAGVGRLAGPRSRVTIHYTARVLGGAPIDSSYDRGLPEVFALPDAPVLGWADGIPGMRMGGRRRLVVPPERAFGAEGIEGLVPPHATIEFEIELEDVED